jgi:hypothetical protein
MATLAADETLGLAALSSAELGQITSAVTGLQVRDPVVSVAPIAYDWGSVATAGLWRVDVTDSAGPASYAYFVKLLQHTRLWPELRFLPDDASRADMVENFPWRAELDMYECEIGAVLPHGMRTPALHHVSYPDADHIALWWEFVPQRPGPWQLADYRRAAYLLGRLAARRNEGAEVNRQLPEVCRVGLDGGGSALRYYTERRIVRGAVPALCGEAMWHHPALVAAMQRTADPDLPGQLRALSARIPQLLDLLDTLPQTHAHGDASPQNLLLPASEPDTVVVIDWGFGTLLPVGFDLGQLLSGLAQAGADPGGLATIDPVIFQGYLDGLRDEGYEVPAGVVRAGYIGGLAARSALCTLPLELLSAGLEPTADTVTVLERGLRLARVLVDLAAELPLLAAAGSGTPGG